MAYRTFTFYGPVLYLLVPRDRAGGLGWVCFFTRQQEHSGIFSSLATLFSSFCDISHLGPSYIN